MSRFALIALVLLMSNMAMAQVGDGLAADDVTVASESVPGASDASPSLPLNKDPMTWFDEISAAFHDKNWSFVIGAILMLSIWGVRRLWSAITKQATSDKSKKALPWIALALGVLLDISTGLVNGIVWWKAIVSGLVSGGSAIALWESVFKHLFPAEKK